jgi:pyruvate dehydrogenase E2 component (dihydrolipoamide acetyltransferase)
MATDFTLPDLGEDIEEAEVIGLLVGVGDVVTADQPLIEVETEKANLEVPAPHAGVIEAIHVQVGDVIKVGQPLVAIAPAAEAASPVAAAEPAAVAVAAPADEVTPHSHGALPAAAPEAEPPPPEVEAPAAAVPSPAPAPALDGRQTSVAASPAVRLFAREVGVLIEEVAGTGPGGRISIEDVKAYARTARATPAAGTPAAAALPDLSQYGEIERERMSATRRATARNLTESWASSPHITLQQKADVTELDALRRKHRDRVTAAGGSLTMLPILMKIIAGALAEFPRLNASIDMQSQEIVYRRYIHVGMATDTERGLVVPVVRDADTKSITELAVEISELAAKARDRKLGLEELRGGTFTISNLGGLGTGFFTAILHPPQVGILTVGRAEQEPVWVDGAFQPRLRMPLGLTVDHRLIDGADAARALSWIVAAIEEPLLLVL